MDYDTGQFPWQHWTPKEYIDAYRHVTDVCRQYDHNAKFMWSPLGADGIGAHPLESYYPGDAYVDFSGITIFGLQKYDRDTFGHDRTFKELIGVRYPRLVRFGKPIIVAELGYEGDDAYVRDWAQSSAQPIVEYPLLKGVVYYDSRDVYPWISRKYGRPNWRVVPDTSGTR
jgi:beta-mannanase